MTEKQENLFMRSVNEYSIRESLAFYHESYALICENFAFCQESCDWFACTLKFRVSSQIFLFLLTCFIERNAFVLEWSAFYRKNLLIEKYFISYMIISLKLFRAIWNGYTYIWIQCIFTLIIFLLTWIRS